MQDALRRRVVPHLHDSLYHKRRGHPDQAEVGRQQARLVGVGVSIDREKGIRLKICPEQLCALVPYVPTQRVRPWCGVSV